MNIQETRITELLGIKYPIIQGGMAWIAESTLASAVTNAGGLGLIGAANAPAEWVRSEIRRAMEISGGKPVGVNIMLLSPYADEVAKVVVEEGVKVVTTGAGNPGKYMDIDEPVATLRLKNVADGMEDYAYLRLCEEIKGSEWVEQKILEISDSLTSYTTDDILLQNVRKELAKAICEAQ